MYTNYTIWTTTYLVNLCSRAWSLTALSLIANGTPARVSPLASTAGCGRTSMGVSVRHLLELGILERNPGHGHPLRPEFQLTTHGEDIAEWAAQLSDMINTDQHKLLLRQKWPLPLLHNLPKEKRYSDLRRELRPVTDRALSNCLSQLRTGNLITRHVSNLRSPPEVSYLTKQNGIKIHRHLVTLPLL